MNSTVSYIKIPCRLKNYRRYNNIKILILSIFLIFLNLRSILLFFPIFFGKQNYYLPYSLLYCFPNIPACIYKATDFLNIYGFPPENGKELGFYCEAHDSKLKAEGKRLGPLAQFFFQTTLSEETKAKSHYNAPIIQSKLKDRKEASNLNLIFQYSLTRCSGTPAEITVNRSCLVPLSTEKGGCFLHRSHNRYSFTRLTAATRTGVPVPDDVAFFGRTKIHHSLDKSSLAIEVWLPGLKAQDLRCSLMQVGSSHLMPMLVISADKNHLLQDWEHKTLRKRSRLGSKVNEDNSKIQRAFRLTRPPDLQTISAKYSDGILQVVIYTDTSSSENMLSKLPYKVSIQDEASVTAIEHVDGSTRNFEDVWEFNWDKFPKLYNMESDYSKIDMPKFLPPDRKTT